MKLVTYKLNIQKGFSLAETLVAVLIILLVSSVVAAGMPAAQKAYTNVMEAADAQLYLSTMLTELRNELATSSNIIVSGNAVTYDHPVTGSSKMEYKSDGTIEVTPYMDLGNTVSHQLVSNSAKTESLKLIFQGTTPFSFSYSSGDTFTVNAFDVKSKNSVLATVSGYKIKILVP